jgi:hypothetical protein
MNNPRQKRTIVRLETVLITFFVLAALSLIIVYFVDSSIYAKTLSFQPTTSDRYPLPATLFLVAILTFIAVIIYGVLHHWRWLFWLLLIANGFSILEVPATILQLSGVMVDPYPTWYSLYRMGIALVQVAIAIWMIRIFYQYGVWGMSRKKQENLPSRI